MSESLVSNIERDGHPDDRLLRLEEVIERGMKTFIEVGKALQEIRDSRLYLQGYSTFDAYCRDRWGWDRVNAHRYVEAAVVVEALSDDNIEGPLNVAQTREIAPLLRRDEQEALALWRELRAEFGKRVTAERIRRVVRPRLERLRREEIRHQTRELPPVGLNSTGSASIHCCDFRDLTVEPGSATLILTDPPYGAEYLPLWRDLGEFAFTALKDGGILVAYSGQTYLPQVMNALCEHLEYWWMIAVGHRHGKPVVWHRRVMNAWKPVLIFTKGKPECDLFSDVIRLGTPGAKEAHPWAQPGSEAETLVEAFSSPGDLVVDPFSGSGTIPIAAEALGRRVLGCEISEVAHRKAADRIIEARKGASRNAAEDVEGRVS